MSSLSIFCFERFALAGRLAYSLQFLLRCDSVHLASAPSYSTASRPDRADRTTRTKRVEILKYTRLADSWRVVIHNYEVQRIFVKT